MFAVVLLSTITFAQQSKNPVTDVLRDTLAGRQKNTVAAIEEMPADKFSAKPTPDQMSFAHLAAHIADANYFFCAKVGDVADPKAEKVTEADSKDKLVAAVKASFDFCGTALAKAEDAKLGDSIQDFTGKPSQLLPNLETVPNQASALAWMTEAVQPLRRLEQRAMHIVGLTKRHPLPVSMLQREQTLLRQEREQLLPRMMACSATGPATVAMIRDIHNDDAVDLTMLADRHVQAYRRWQQRIALTRTLLSAGPMQTEERRRVLPMMPSAV
jgi:hypothetical protein